MADRITPAEAADRLRVTRAQVEAMIGEGWLPEPDQGLLPLEAVEGLDRMLLVFEAALLGLEGLDEPPAAVPPLWAAEWLDVSLAEVEALEQAGRLERVAWADLSDDEVVQLLFAAEAAAEDEYWTERDALDLDLIAWKVRIVGMPLRAKDLAAAQRVVGDDVLYSSSSVRGVARTRARFNPLPG
ncbi:MAG: hypothetical protein AB7N76_12615 [Planctomycetota bacterium]